MRLLILILLAGAAWAQEVVPGRFIVELAGEPALTARDARARREQIRSEHNSLERALRARQARVVARVDTVANAVIVEAASDAALAGLPGVRRVEPVRKFHVLLDKALPIHQVPEAWAQTGGMEQAGAGVKIGIIDTGIDPLHACFQAPAMTVPDGYPQASSDDNRKLTNNKIIVARSYDAFSALDSYGHGTAVAMAAAGVQHQSPRGVISGVAPAAWLGVYRGSDVGTGELPSDYVLRALDDAVNDGMDVINMSFGSVGLVGTSSGVLFDGVNRTLDRGIVVVCAAGNEPGPMTVGDTASNPKVIAVGASLSKVSVQAAVYPSAGPPIVAAASSNAGASEPVSGPLVSIESFDSTELGCSAFPPNSMVGKIPLIRRGVCNFWEKLANAAAAGAPAAVVYNRPDADASELVTMNVDDNPTIPGLFVVYGDGLALKELIRTVEDLQVSLRFGYASANPNQLASFSSHGPSVELAIKPDIVASGQWIYTAAVAAPYDANSCPVCNPSGYALVQGTSFAAPLVSGSAAVLKSARKGLEGADYRSLLINSSAPMVAGDTTPVAVQSAGAGRLNLLNSVTSTLTAAPVSVSFGAGGGTVDQSRTVTFKNLGTEDQTLALAVSSNDPVKASLSSETLTLAAGSTADATLSFTGGGLTAGAYQGFLRATNVATGAEIRVPYWYGMRSQGPPASVVQVQVPYKAQAGTTVRVYLRVHDQAGLPLDGPPPVVTPVSGGGVVVEVVNYFGLYPNVWMARIRLASRAGLNIFRADAGDATTTFYIDGY